MKQAGVRELKAKLSGFLRAVGRGEVIVITDRGRPVAELSPPVGEFRKLLSREGMDKLQYRRLVGRGLIRPATAAKPKGWPSQRKAAGAQGTKTGQLPKGSTQTLLDKEREE